MEPANVVRRFMGGPSPRVRWAFLDVGNILLDEDPVAYRCTRIHYNEVLSVRPDLSFAALLALREAKAAQSSRWPLYEAVAPLLGEEGCARAWTLAEREIRTRYDDLSPVVDGARQLVDRLSRRFRLGLIANQGPECRARLEALGLMHHFPVAVFAEEAGLAKPDARLFRMAIERAGAEPGECAMIGDRLDNDIAPAAALGMKTCWVRWPRRAAKGWRPDDPDALAFRDSLERIAAGLTTSTRPDLSVDDLESLEPSMFEARGLL